MRLLSLNLWAGKLHEDLMQFLQKHAAEFDIFCFQEPYSSSDKNIFEECKEILSGHAAYFPPLNNEDSPSIFVRKSIQVEVDKKIPVYKDGNSDYQVDLGCLSFTHHGTTYTIANIHGFWKAKDKNDNPERIQQSENIKAALAELPGLKILCGDFNISPMTESIRILEEFPLRNLIKESRIESTRTHLFAGKEKIADYILVSPELLVSRFEILPDIVSDHLPLQLEFR